MVAQKLIHEWLFHTFLNNEILSEFEGQIIDLLNMCSTDGEIDVVKHTIEKLNVMTYDQMHLHLIEMAKYASNICGDEENIAIVAMAYDSAADGSQLLVQMLKPIIRNKKNIKIFNSVPSYVKKGKLETYPKFILVDDFSGTGNTVLNRLKYIEDTALDRGIVLTPHVCLIFGMEKAKRKIVENGYDVHFLRELKAGISGYFNGNELVQKIASMKRLEGQLAPEIDGKKVPSLGYGEAEALHFVQNANAPNSNFPIFWWPFDVNNMERNTIMVRAEL